MTCHGRFKVVLLGESSVGKTCLLRSLVGEEFTPHSMSTIGVDFKRKKFAIHNRSIELEIWDTAGQEKFRTITSFQYRNARGIVLVYDITNRLSFERMLNYWRKSISEHAGDDLIPLFVVGNKVDLASQRQVSHKEGLEAHERCGSYEFFETSSRTGEKVQELFAAVAAAMFSVWKPLLLHSPGRQQSTSVAGAAAARTDSILLHQPTDPAVAKARRKAACCH